MKRWILVVIAMMISATVSAMELVAAQSSLHFVSIKNDSVAELGQFKSLEGNIAADGAVELMIDLASLATGIEQRDQRMRDVLFEIVQFPQARVRANLPAIAEVGGMQVGQELDMEIQGQLTLHGAQQAIIAQVRVIKLADRSLRVTTRVPVLLQAGKFELDGGIEKLRTLASLDSIDSAVPVYFSLVFAAR